MTGIETSSRAMSGFSSRARRTASWPFTASPETSNPAAVSSARKPARTIAWSSATRTRNGISALQRNDRVQAGALLRGRRDLERAADRFEAGARQHQAETVVGVARERGLDIESDAVVGDGAPEPRTIARNRDRRRRGVRVLVDVRQRFPHEPVDDRADRSGATLVQVDVDCQFHAATTGERARHEFDRVTGAEILDDAWMQLVRDAPQLLRDLVEMLPDLMQARLHQRRRVAGDVRNRHVR